MKSLLATVTVLLCCCFPKDSWAEPARTFSSKEEAVVNKMLVEFSDAMGKSKIDPIVNCPSLREGLRSKIKEIEPLIEKASLLKTDSFFQSDIAGNILDVELAYKYVDENCASMGV